MDVHPTPFRLLTWPLQKQTACIYPGFLVVFPLDDSRTRVTAYKMHVVHRYHFTASVMPGEEDPPSDPISRETNRD